MALMSRAGEYGKEGVGWDIVFYGLQMVLIAVVFVDTYSTSYLCPFWASSSSAVAV
jgi:hypothetical protein